MLKGTKDLSLSTPSTKPVSSKDHRLSYRGHSELPGAVATASPFTGTKDRSTSTASKSQEEYKQILKNYFNNHRYQDQSRLRSSTSALCPGQVPRQKIRLEQTIVSFLGQVASRFPGTTRTKATSNIDLKQPSR